MRTYLAVSCGVLAGMAIGAFAVQGLHAQAKASIYLITEIAVKDADRYGAEFAPKAPATINAGGGKFIVIGGTAGASAKPITAMDGSPPKRFTVQQCESMDAMKKWYDGADFQAALNIGKQYADFRRFSIEGQQ